MMSFPGVPVDTISVRWVCAMMIKTVQVWCMTGSVPPGSFIIHSTVTARGTVIILIFGWKGVATMTRKRISCCPWKQNMGIWSKSGAIIRDGHPWLWLLSKCDKIKQICQIPISQTFKTIKPFPICLICIYIFQLRFALPFTPFFAG